MLITEFIKDEAGQIDPSLAIDALLEERETLRKKADSYKGAARGRVTPRAAEIDNILRWFNSGKVEDDIYIIYQSLTNFKNVFKYGKAEEDTAINYIFKQYTGYIYSLDNPERIFSDKQDFQFLIKDAEGIKTKFFRSRKLDIAIIITGILQGFSDLQKIIELYDGSRPKFFPPLSSFLYKLESVEFNLQQPNEMSRVVAAREDAFFSASDSVEITYMGKEAPPALTLEFVATGFKNDGEYKNTFSANASAGYTSTITKAAEAAEILDEKLTPRYGDSSTIFTVSASVDYSQHRDKNKIITIRLYYSRNSG